MTYKKTFFIALLLVLLVVLFAGAWLVSVLKARTYSVVYLASREVYIGYLSTFPRLALKDGYLLQAGAVTANPDGTTTPAKQELVPLSAKSWAVDKIYLNRDQVLFHGPLSDNSEALQAIKTKVK